METGILGIVQPGIVRSHVCRITTKKKKKRIQNNIATVNYALAYGHRLQRVAGFPRHQYGMIGHYSSTQSSSTARSVDCRFVRMHVSMHGSRSHAGCSSEQTLCDFRTELFKVRTHRLDQGD